MKFMPASSVFTALASPARANDLQRLPMRHALQPRPRALNRRADFDFHRERQEDKLRSVFGIVRVARHAPAFAMHQRSKTANDLLEIFGLSGPPIDLDQLFARRGAVGFFQPGWSLHRRDSSNKTPPMRNVYTAWVDFEFMKTFF